jgi:nicotinate-nucleotide adenylyltransferase
VFDRPGFGLKARASKPAQRFAAFRVDETDCAGLALLEPPAWTWLSLALSGVSSTSLRETNAGKPTKAPAKAKPSKKKSKPH